MPRSMTSWGRNSGKGRAALLLACLLVTACSNDVPLAEQVEEQVRRGEADRALALLAQEIRARPTDWATQDLRVRVLLQAERADEALQAYAERWTQGGRDTSALFRGIAVALLREGMRLAGRPDPDAGGCGAGGPGRPRTCGPCSGRPSPTPRSQSGRWGRRASARSPGTRRIGFSGPPSTIRNTRCGRPLLAALAGRHDPDTLAALRAALADPAPSVRMCAAVVLARTGDPGSVRLLDGSSRRRERFHPHANDRSVGATGSARHGLGRASTAHRPQSVCSDICRRGPGAPGGAGGPPPTPGGPDRPAPYGGPIRRGGVVESGRRRGVRALASALASGGDVSVRLYAAWTLARLGDAQGRPVLEELLRHPDAQVRMQAAWTLGECGMDRGFPV